MRSQEAILYILIKFEYSVFGFIVWNKENSTLARAVEKFLFLSNGYIFFFYMSN